MSSRTLLGLTRVLSILAVATLLAASGRTAGPKFYPDDPISVDPDTKFDAGDLPEVELSEQYDFLENSFRSPGDQRNIRALNVNTIDEVPDSSWFTNRLGHRPMSIEEIVKGPDRSGLKLGDGWTITRAKSPGGFQPGFRAVNQGDPTSQLYQVEFDPPGNPEMATGAELIGTAIYHAVGYNTVDMYLVDVDPKKLKIADTATKQDASGVRKFRQADLDDILKVSAKMPDGRYRALASRFVDEKRIGRFKYYGSRSDDPNDIYPHEHRRELRANRVFGAWVNHDDSRAVNTLNTLVKSEGRWYIRHYMYDFGSIMGSATRFSDNRQSGREYLLEKGLSLATLATLGLYVRPWLLYPYPHDVPPAAGSFNPTHFEPEKWRPEYPNAAFSNMRPDDAFWGARIVAAFSDEAIQAVVAKARYSDTRASDYIAGTLVKRRDAIAKTWLNGVNPVINPALSSDGILTFDNAAVAAGAATPATEYQFAWSRFDNVADTHTKVGDTTSVQPRAQAPSELLASGEFVSVAIRSKHPEHPAWSKAVQVYFRRAGNGWKLVGLEREI